MAEELAGYGYFEICGVVFALLYVLLAIREYRVCWIAAIVSSLAYIPTFYIARLYTETVLQLFFIATSLYGWFAWGKKKNQEINKNNIPVVLKISVWPLLRHIKLIFLSVIISGITGLILSEFSNASFPYIDAAITVFSIGTTWLQARKILENWVYWIVIDSLAVMVYIKKGLLLTSGLYGLYVILALGGLIEWKKHYNNNI